MQSNYNGAVSINLFGQSHGEAIGVVIGGLASGIPIDMEYIGRCLEKRKAKGDISTKRKEEDIPHIVSGIYQGKTTGTPLTIIIENTNQKSIDYSKIKDFPRPSHGDYSGREKYGGFEDFRGGGHFSGRLTAPIVAAGAIFKQILQKKGIIIATHLLRCGGVEDEKFSQNEEILKKQIEIVDSANFPVICKTRGDKMCESIKKAATEGDSVGGILESSIHGLPPGIGEPFFSSVESVLSALLFSIPGIKGVEFGLGFNFADEKASAVNDQIRVSGARVITLTNNNGGINGGVTNSMPVIVKCVVKPTPSIFKLQKTVNLATMENEDFTIAGRHDPCIAHRAAIVADAMLSIGICDLFTQRYGYMWQVKE